MEDWGLGEASPLSIGDRGFRDWVQDKYAELVSTHKHKQDIAFRASEKTLAPDAILAILAGVMECEASAFNTRAHRRPHRPFAAHFLTRFGGLARRDGTAGVGAPRASHAFDSAKARIYES
jgi:hypothetical protein